MRGCAHHANVGRKPVRIGPVGLPDQNHGTELVKRPDQPDAVTAVAVYRGERGTPVKADIAVFGAISQEGRSLGEVIPKLLVLPKHGDEFGGDVNRDAWRQCVDPALPGDVAEVRDLDCGCRQAPSPADTRD